MQKIKLTMLGRTMFLISAVKPVYFMIDGKNHAKTRTINESYRQYVNINVHVSCFTIIVMQENITLSEMLNYLCTEPYFVSSFSYLPLIYHLMNQFKTSIFPPPPGFM